MKTVAKKITITKEIELYHINELKEINHKAYNKILNKARELAKEDIYDITREIFDQLVEVFEWNNFRVNRYESGGEDFIIITADIYHLLREEVEKCENKLLADLENLCKGFDLLTNFFIDCKREDFETFTEYVGIIFNYLFDNSAKQQAYYNDDKNLIQHMEKLNSENLFFTIDGIAINDL